jgi:hypothetical protein
VQPIALLSMILILTVGFYLQARICIGEGVRRERRRLASLPIDAAKDELMAEWAKAQQEEW